MNRDALERARRRIAEAGRDGPDAAELAAALEGAKTGLEALAATAAELQVAVPEHLGAAVRAGMEAEVLPVARHIADVRNCKVRKWNAIRQRATSIVAKAQDHLSRAGPSVH